MGLCAQLVTAIFGGPEVALFPPVVKVGDFDTLNCAILSFPPLDPDGRTSATDAGWPARGGACEWL